MNHDCHVNLESGAPLRRQRIGRMSFQHLSSCTGGQQPAQPSEEEPSDNNSNSAEAIIASVDAAVHDHIRRMNAQ